MFERLPAVADVVAWRGAGWDQSIFRIDADTLTTESRLFAIGSVPSRLLGLELHGQAAIASYSAADVTLFGAEMKVRNHQQAAKQCTR